MEEEIWKDCAGYEGLYEVSNLGRVRDSASKSIMKTWVNRCSNDRNYIMVYWMINYSLYIGTEISRTVLLTI